ncbi:MAG: 1-acyl-sn-glycerol-3-phosphate acyltransferase [Verrucomicrobia bacterium]|nr:1-acyl-sn-glycerol-3-phosphate acyltransferase [Verrucomicrobiota bacterium]
MSDPASAHAVPASGWTQRLAAALARALARTVCGLEVRGLEHLPAGEPFLLCANHSSHADTFALAAATGAHGRRLIFLGARDYFSRFALRTWFIGRLINLVPFERGFGLAAAKHNLSLLAACRDAGRIIVLYPEGTRSTDGLMRDFKPGVGMFAEKLQLRVVPCHLAGTHAMLPKGRNFPRARRLRATFGPPLAVPLAPSHETGPARAARYAAYAAELQSRVTALASTPPAADAARLVANPLSP